MVGPADPDIALIKYYSKLGFEIIAADGGANLLFEQGILPAAIIGDLDSMKSGADIGKQTTLIQIGEQDSTDFEKCLYSVDAPMFLAIGFIGRRFDHTLANVHAMAKYANQKNVLLIGPQDFSFAHIGKFATECFPGDIVSIFPLAPIRFLKSTGLKFALDKLTFDLGHSIGISNEANDRHIEISPATDSLSTPYLVTLSLERLSDFVEACWH